MDKSTGITIKDSPGDPSIEVEVVSRALEQTPQPVTAKQLREKLTGPFKLAETKLLQLLEEQVTTGRVYRFAPRAPSKQYRYWSRDPEEYARESMLTLLGQRPHTKAELL